MAGGMTLNTDSLNTVGGTSLGGGASSRHWTAWSHGEVCRRGASVLGNRLNREWEVWPAMAGRDHVDLCPSAHAKCAQRSESCARRVQRSARWFREVVWGSLLVGCRCSATPGDSLLVYRPAKSRIFATTMGPNYTLPQCPPADFFGMVRVLASGGSASGKTKSDESKKRAYGTPDSHVVPHRSTDEACSGLTAQFGRDTVCYTEYGRRHLTLESGGPLYPYSEKSTF